MPDGLRIGVIWVGDYPLQYHLPILKRSPDADLIAIHRRSPKKLRQAAKQFGVPKAFTNYREMLDSVKMDGVVVSGPHGLHYDCCKYALERDLHVLVDKPMVHTSEEAEGLVALADERGLVLCVGFNRRFDPANLYARSMIHEGHLGEIFYACSVQFGFPPIAGTWRNDKELGGGPLYGRGAHMLDLIPWTTGLMPEAITASVIKKEGLQTDIGGTITLECQGGMLAQVTCLVRKGHGRDEVHYYGTKGSISVKRPFPFQVGPAPYAKTYALEVEHVGTWAVEHCGAEGNLVYHAALPPAYTTTEHFIDVILGRDENRASGEDGLWSVRTLEAALESAETGRRVNLEH